MNITTTMTMWIINCVVFSGVLVSAGTSAGVPPTVDRFGTTIQLHTQTLCYGDFYNITCQNSEVFAPIRNTLGLKDPKFVQPRNCSNGNTPYDRDCCIANSTDCTFGSVKDFKNILTICSGKHSCTGQKATWDAVYQTHPQMSGPCPAQAQLIWPITTQYVKTEYMCVPLMSMSTMCEASTLKGKGLFLQSRAYPSGSPAENAGYNCSCQVKASAPVRVAALDVRLCYSSVDCGQTLTVGDQVYRVAQTTLQSSTVASFVGLHELQNQGAKDRDLTIRVTNDDSKNKLYLWLYIYAGGSEMELVCDEEVSITTSTAPTTAPTTSADRTSRWYQNLTTEPTRYCDQTSYSASGVIESPNYPLPYYNDLNCHYELLTSTISLLRVDAIDLEGRYDSLEISYLSPMGYREYVNLTGSDGGHDMVGKDFRIDFRTDGSNTRKGFQLSWRLAPDNNTSNWRWQTTDWGWGTTLPWWKYTTDSLDKISINCNSHDFTVSVPRDVIRQVFPGVSEYNLALNNPNCRGQVYQDVLMFRSNILGCGMTREETRYDIVYQNRIRPVNSGRYTTDSYRWYTTEAPIVRLDSADIKVECHLDNYATAIGHFKPTNNHELIAVGRGNISVYMDFYRDYNYNYKITSYPISLGLNEDVYVDLRLDSDDNGLHMAVQRCIATPSYNRYTSEYHTLITSGCPADQTVAFEHSSGQHVHFRFRGFEFLREKSNVFIFCDVNICNSTDYRSRCHRNCNRRRRDAESEPNSDLNLFQGPLKSRDVRSADQNGGNAIHEKATQSMSISASVMAISAVAMVIAAVVLVIKRRKRNGQLLT